MTLIQASGAAFVNGYGRAWASWDVPRFVDLFSDEVVYVAHPTKETVVGRAALESYVRKEQAEQGDVSVRMGHPITEGNHVGAEFWVTATKGGETTTIAGCFIARLAPDGRCEFFREYWFDIVAQQRVRGMGGVGDVAGEHRAVASSLC